MSMIGNFGICPKSNYNHLVNLLEKNPSPETDAFIEEIYKGFRQYNRTSTKPYNITVSAGTCLISAKAEIGLKEALNLADGKLYEEKQHKEKTVAKG